MNDLVVVIVCYNSKEFLTGCLNTAGEAIKAQPATVFVVDNGGNDGTAAWVQQHYPWCQVIDSRENGGYSYGNNLALKAVGFPEAAQFRYAMLLNPDTEMPPDALSKMVSYMDTHPNLGVLSPRIVLPDGSLDIGCRRNEPTPLASFYHLIGLARLFPRSHRFAHYAMTWLPEDQTTEIGSAVGACMLMRGEALAKAGLMDERFFMYGEDLDINLRIKELGYQIVYWPEVIIKHLKGTSTRKEPERMIRAYYDAMALFHRKHYVGRYPRFFNVLVYTAIEIICQIRLLRARLSPTERHVMGGILSRT